LVDRIVDCNHWLGEPPYDSKRAKEIESAVTELRCNELTQDKSGVLRKHHGNQAVERAIHKAEETVL